MQRLRIPFLWERSLPIVLLGRKSAPCRSKQDVFSAVHKTDAPPSFLFSQTCRGIENEEALDFILEVAAMSAEVISFGHALHVRPQFLRGAIVSLRLGRLMCNACVRLDKNTQWTRPRFTLKAEMLLYGQFASVRVEHNELSAPEPRGFEVMRDCS